ncbi:MAG: hypothetical protein ABUS47_02015 [Steroidobacter sp.]
MSDQPDNNQPDDDQPYWIRVARTRRHIYYRARNNVPGMLLFGIIAVLGCVALIVGARHIIMAKSVQHPDVVLVIVGMGALLLGIYQGWQLWLLDHRDDDAN